MKEKERPAAEQSSWSQLLTKEQAVTAILLAVALTAGFYLTNQYMAAQRLAGKIFWSPALAVDHIIPFSPGWIWIYLLYFPLCFLPIAFREVWNDIGLFRRTALGFLVQFLIALSIFWILPSQMQRPIFHPTGLSARAVLWFYRIDAGFNIFPSLHVANVAYIAMLAGKLKSRFLSLSIWTLCALIAASTLFVKQHYLLDLPAGVLTGVLGYFAAFLWNRKIPQKN